MEKKIKLSIGLMLIIGILIGTCMALLIIGLKNNVKESELNLNIKDSVILYEGVSEMSATQFIDKFHNCDLRNTGSDIIVSDIIINEIHFVFLVNCSSEPANTWFMYNYHIKDKNTWWYDNICITTEPGKVYSYYVNDKYGLIDFHAVSYNVNKN